MRLTPRVAGFRSEYPAGFKLECMVGFVGTRTTSQLAEDGKKFKVDPSRLLYALRWLNWDEPPDLDLTLVRDPALWFKDVTTLLLGALNRHDPHLFDAVPLPAG